MNALKSKNAKYLDNRTRARYYKLLEIPAARRTDSDVEEIVELEMRADRIADREKAVVNKRSAWEE